jgi:hypothetical protein
MRFALRRSVPLPLPMALIAGAVLLGLLATPTSAASWRPVVTIASSGHLTGSDSLAVSGSTVHAVYNRAGVITYQRSTDGGRTFHPTTIVRSSGINRYTALGIAAYGGRVGILYGKVRSDTTTVTLYAKVSFDGGLHWSNPSAVTGWSQSGGGWDAAIAVSSTNFAVAATLPGGYVTVWHSANPTSRQWRGIDNGLGRTTNRAVQNDPAHLTGNVALVAWADRVAAFWAPDGIGEGTVGHIVMRQSYDDGATWGSEVTVASDAAVVVGARPAAVSAFSTNIVLAYQRSDGKGVVVRMRHWGNWIEPHSVTPPPTAGGNPDIQDVFIGYGGIARVVYAAYASDGSVDKLWVRTSTTSGTTWGPPVLAVGSTPTNKSHANLGSTSQGFVVMFERFASPYGGVSSRAFS